ncbi:MAG: hypothetical protein QM811_06830 [Pirellulales bacterium]
MTPSADQLRAAIRAAIASGETQSTIADKAGTSQTEVSLFLSGKKKDVYTGTQDKLAKALGLKVKIG